MFNDISMCLSKNCPKALYCFRITAKPDSLQSYSDFSNSCNESNNFKMWLKNKNYYNYKESKFNDKK